MRIKGKITQWDDAKGFGFIQPMLKGERVFVHVKALQNRIRRPVIGEVVTYSVGKDDKGRAQANAVTFAGEKLIVKVGRTSSRWPLLLVFIFITALLAAFASDKLPLYIIAAYAVVSLVTFISYWLDKRKAQAGSRRIPEAHLQFLSLFGGWPGALLGQNYLRHKSKKRAFLTVFWLAVLANLAGLSLLAVQGILPMLSPV